MSPVHRFHADGVQKDGGNGTMYRPVHAMKRGADVSNIYIYIYNMHIQNIYTAYIAIMHILNINGLKHGRQYEYTICIYLSV